MKLKYFQIVNSLKPLEMLMDQKMPMKSAIKLRRAVSALVPHAEDYEKLRKKVVDQYGEKDDNGDLIIKDNMISLTDREAAEADLTTLNDTEIELDVPKIDSDKLGDAVIDARSLIALDWLIE